MVISNQAERNLQKHMEDDPELQELLEKARIKTMIAHTVSDIRTAAGLTQKQLADLIGSSQSVISRLEDADYDGDSMSMIQRIATAFDREIVIEIR